MSRPAVWLVILVVLWPLDAQARQDPASVRSARFSRCTD